MLESSVNTLLQTECTCFHEGLIDYAKAEVLQEHLSNLRAAHKIPDSILLLQHMPVITIGKAGKPANILANYDYLAGRDIGVFQTDRGGDVTYHGPGQLVAYFIFDLNKRFEDIPGFVRLLEQSVILTLCDYGLNGHIDMDYPGVWVENNKICAIGLKIKNWITKHGLAININTSLENFTLIQACGIKDPARGVTSMQQLLGHPLEIADVSERLVYHLSSVFNLNITRVYVDERING